MERETLREDKNGKRDTKRDKKDKNSKVKLRKKEKEVRRLVKCFVTQTIGFWFCRSQNPLQFSSILI